MKPHIFRIKDQRGEWFLIHDGKRSVETGLKASEAEARRDWERLHGTPPDGYAWMPTGETYSVKAATVLIAQASATAGDTVRLVPLSELVAFARLVVAMRKAQADYFQKRKSKPYLNADTELNRARDAESKVDGTARAVLQREQGTLPGMFD